MRESDFLVTSDRLGSTRVAKDDVANEGADRDGEHDPAVVSHEQQPSHRSANTPNASRNMPNS